MKPEKTLRVIQTDVNRKIEESLRTIQYLMSEKMALKTKIQREIAMLHILEMTRRERRFPSNEIPRY